MARASGSKRDDNTTPAAVIILQFLVGGLVTLGGLEFARNAVNPFGTMLGLIHLSIGLGGVVAGILIIGLRSRNPRLLLLAINAITIGYSSFSETMVYVDSLLGSVAFDSLVGTIAALAMSFTIIYLLLSSRESSSRAASHRQAIAIR